MRLRHWYSMTSHSNKRLRCILPVSWCELVCSIEKILFCGISRVYSQGGASSIELLSPANVSSCENSNSHSVVGPMNEGSWRWWPVSINCLGRRFSSPMQHKAFRLKCWWKRHQCEIDVGDGANTGPLHLDRHCECWLWQVPWCLEAL